MDENGIAAWLRVDRADTSGVENLGGWLTTVVARVCLNLLRSRRHRSEEPIDLREFELVSGGSRQPTRPRRSRHRGQWLR